MLHGYETMAHGPDLKRLEAKLEKTLSPEVMVECSRIYVSRAGGYVSDQIVEMIRLGYVAEWISKRDDPSIHIDMVVKAIKLILAEE